MRYGLEVFRRFFKAIVEQCQQAGMVWGRELYFDATKMLADAAMDSLLPALLSRRGDPLPLGRALLRGALSAEAAGHAGHNADRNGTATHTCQVLCRGPK
jgi:hypothetical protein